MHIRARRRVQLGAQLLHLLLHLSNAAQLLLLRACAGVLCMAYGRNAFSSAPICSAENMSMLSVIRMEAGEDLRGDVEIEDQCGTC